MNRLLRTISGCDPEEARSALLNYWRECRLQILFTAALVLILALLLLYLDRAQPVLRLPGPFLLHPDSQGFTASDMEEAAGVERWYQIRPSALIPLLIVLPLLLPPAWRTAGSQALKASQFARSFFAWSLAGFVIALGLLRLFPGHGADYWGWQTLLLMALGLNPVIPFGLALSFQTPARRHWRQAWIVAGAYALALLINECVQWISIWVDMSSSRSTGVDSGYIVGAVAALVVCVAMLLRPQRSYWAYLATLVTYLLSKLFCLWLAHWLPMPVLAFLSRLSLPAGLYTEDNFVSLWTSLIK